MKRRLLRGLMAALLAVTVTVPASTPPAQAFDLDDIVKVIDLANRAVTLVKNILGGGVSKSDINAAVAQIVAKVEASKTEILNHIDQIAAAQVRACARHHVIEFQDIDLFNETTLQGWAQDATGCAVLADSLLDSGVSSKPALDTIGFALNVVAPIALAARAKAGFSLTGLLSTLRGGELAVITKLKPACTLTPLWPAPEGWGPYEVLVRCTAYDGTVASGTVWKVGEWGGRYALPPAKYAHIADSATRFTSRAIARDVIVTIDS